MPLRAAAFTNPSWSSKSKCPGLGSIVDQRKAWRSVRPAGRGNRAPWSSRGSGRRPCPRRRRRRSARRSPAGRGQRPEVPTQRVARAVAVVVQGVLHPVAVDVVVVVVVLAVGVGVVVPGVGGGGRRRCRGRSRSGAGRRPCCESTRFRRRSPSMSSSRPFEMPSPSTSQVTAVPDAGPGPRPWRAGEPRRLFALPQARRFALRRAFFERCLAFLAGQSLALPCDRDLRRPLAPAAGGAGAAARQRARTRMRTPPRERRMRST